LVHRAEAILTQTSLYYEARVKLVIVSGHRTNHSAFPTIQTQAYLGVVYDALIVEHLPMYLEYRIRR